MPALYVPEGPLPLFLPLSLPLPLPEAFLLAAPLLACRAPPPLFPGVPRCALALFCPANLFKAFNKGVEKVKSSRKLLE